jgi:hypothetical protein
MLLTVPRRRCAAREVTAVLVLTAGSRALQQLLLVAQVCVGHAGVFRRQTDSRVGRLLHLYRCRKALVPTMTTELVGFRTHVRTTTMVSWYTL